MTNVLAVPPHLWIGVAVAFFVGVVLLVIRTRLRRESLPSELLRDIGIAFIVAGVVSLTYEYSTRSLEERDTLLDTINHAMLEFVPPNVWNEVKDQIIRQHAIRRNVQIKLRLTRTAPLVNGKSVAVPANQAVMWMSYGYDLYGLAAGDSHIDISHTLDYVPMWNADLRLPRFDKVTVTDSGGGETVYQNETLSKVYDGAGRVYLPHIELHPIADRKPVRIMTERYELVNVPGYYHLVMRELTARGERDSAPSIKVIFEGLPADVETAITTFYAPHGFTKPDPQKNVWLFDKTMLPGQGLDIMFWTKPPKK